MFPDERETIFAILIIGVGVGEGVGVGVGLRVGEEVGVLFEGEGVNI